jgi:ankyrin repeat protein
MLRILLEYGAYVNAQDSYNRTSMHWSICNNNTHCLKVLIEYDANIHVKDRDGMSPAMWACHLDNIEHFKILTHLYENDTNELDSDNDGRTWLHWCVRKQDPLECLNVKFKKNKL